MPTPQTVEDTQRVFGEALGLTQTLGTRGAQVNFSWGTLEPSVGAYDTRRLAELQAEIDRARLNRSALFVGLQFINTPYRDGPADLQALPFDDPRVRSQFRRLLDKIVGANRGAIRYLSIGNEVDVYLGTRPTEVAAYTAFLRDAAAYARALDPAIQVGVTFTATGALGAHQGLLRALNDGITDVVIFTYYPLVFDATGRFVVRPPSSASADFRSLLDIARGKPVVLQEVGFPSADGNNSSESLQREFIGSLFTAWVESGDRIPYLNLFALHDFPPEMCDALVLHYQMPGSASFRDYLCSLGLRRADGTQKMAWAEAVMRAAAISRSSTPGAD